ncbi:hypothetical protein K0038_00177 [Pseudomonas syringae]|nr:hypothetical protein [Pseudomonas syringae]
MQRDVGNVAFDSESYIGVLEALQARKGSLRMRSGALCLYTRKNIAVWPATF